MQSADFLSAVFFYLKVGENLNQNWIVENLNNAFSTWNGKLGELWGLVTTGPQTFKGGAVWSCTMVWLACRLLVCEIVSLIGSGHQNFTWFALRYSVGDVPSMLLNVLQK